MDSFGPARPGPTQAQAITAGTTSFPSLSSSPFRLVRLLLGEAYNIDWERDLGIATPTGDFKNICAMRELESLNKTIGER